MLTFNPPELEARLRKALSKLTDSVSFTINDAEINHDFEAEDFDHVKVTPTTEVALELPRCEPETLSAEVNRPGIPGDSIS
jgi:hypothetical protein